MATTTPNYGWAVPTSTDLVKDGATAIETLGDAIDASMNTALGTKKAGMVLLNTTSFSAVASQSISDVFSTTYDNYRIVLSDLTAGTGTPDLNFRFRVSGADNSTSNYNYQKFYFYSTSGLETATAQTQFTLTTFSSVPNAFFDITNPFATKKTAMTGFVNVYQTNVSAYVTRIVGCDFDATTSFTGFTFYPTASTITGTVSVYGYND